MNETYTPTYTRTHIKKNRRPVKSCLRISHPIPFQFYFRLFFVCFNHHFLFFCIINFEFNEMLTNTQNENDFWLLVANS